MIPTRTVPAGQVKPGDILYGFRHVTSVYQMIEGSSFFATFRFYDGGTEFKTFLGYDADYPVVIHS